MHRTGQSRAMKRISLIIISIALSWLCHADNHSENIKSNINNNLEKNIELNYNNDSDSAGRKFSAEDKLEAIKQALVDLALDSNIKINSKAYLDDEGILHESNTITSDVEIRGVRVESYVREKAGINTAKLRADLISDETCPGNRYGLVREAVVQVNKNFKNHRVGNHYLNEINEKLENTVVDKLSSVEGWAVSGFSVEEPYYMRLVSGRPGNHAAYRIEISTRLLPNKADKSHTFNTAIRKMNVFNRKKSDFLPSQQLEVNITLLHVDVMAPLWKKSYSLLYPSEPVGYVRTALPNKFQDELSRAAESLILEMQQVFECRLEYFKIEKAAVGEKGFVLRGGSFNGISEGDQFLLSKNPKILSQKRGSTSLAGLALAEVEFVEARKAKLIQIAGPDIPDLARYVALPF